MEYRRLGNTGLKVSRLCLGMMSYGSPDWRDWVLDEAEAEPFVRAALDAGINFFDTAEMYSNGASEQVTGNLIGKLVANRHDVVIATKVFMGTENIIMGDNADKVNSFGLSRKHIIYQCEQSLRRLGTDYIDLYQIHRLDPNVPMEEFLEALNDLVRAGKVRYLGASSMYAWQFMKCLALSERNNWSRFVCMQPQYNLMYREEEREMLPLCADQGVGVIPWSPLARGHLCRSSFSAGDTTRSQSDELSQWIYNEAADNDVVVRNAEVAARLGVKPAQTALAWVLSNSTVTAPIIGVTKLPQLQDALEAVSLELSAEDKQRLEEPYRPHAVAGV
jgi:aryl-alcohol dehydrogenase-like predicted oxidoreductase